MPQWTPPDPPGQQHTLQLRSIGSLHDDQSPVAARAYEHLRWGQWLIAPARHLHRNDPVENPLDRRSAHASGHVARVWVGLCNRDEHPTAERAEHGCRADLVEAPPPEVQSN